MKNLTYAEICAKNQDQVKASDLRVNKKGKVMSNSYGLGPSRKKDKESRKWGDFHIN